MNDNESNENSEAGSPAGLAPSKPQRPAPSCDFCRRLKIKCERKGLGGKCGQCTARDAECKTTVVPRKPKPRRKDNLQLMESRIRQMESVIASKISTPESSEDLDEGSISRQVGISDNLSMIVINEQGGSQFVGSSSGFSLFSPRGLRWISEKTGNRNLERLVSQVIQLDPETWDQGCWNKFDDFNWHPIPSEQLKPLPEKDLASEYVEAFFLSCNSIFPLFNRAIFLRRFERQYSDAPPTDSSWYASFNMVLAIGSALINTEYPLGYPCHILRGGLDLSQEPSSGYLRNATSVLIDIQFGRATLLSVQAVVAMAFLLQGTSNPLQAYTLVATAARLAHAIGLHRWLDDFGLSQEQADERRNVFWLLYMVDKGTSLQTGRPSVIHDNDIGIALPREKDPTLVFPSGKRNFDTFTFSAKLAMIESRVYSELYSTRSRTRSVLQRLKSIGILDKQLQKWLEDMPIEIRPGYEIVCDEQQLMPIIMLHYSYFNCLTAIHRVSIYHGPWTSDPADQKFARRDIDLNPRVYDSEAICVAAARNVIKILDYFKMERTPPVIWIAVSQPICASLSLFANILQHPRDPHGISDLNMIQDVITLLTQLVSQGRLAFATTVLWIIQELHRIAGLFLARELSQTQVSADGTTSSKPLDPEPVLLPHDIPPTIPDALFPNQNISNMTSFNDNMLALLDTDNSFQLDGTDIFPRDDPWFWPMDIQ